MEEKKVEVKSLEQDFKGLESKVTQLVKTVNAMAKVIHMLRHESTTAQVVKATTDKVLNKDGLPLNSAFIGVTKNQPHPIILTVETDGTYKIGSKKFGSLSAAAKEVSGVRRSGWTFWKTAQGQTLKEAFKR
jgi:Zn-dependent M32 family carboxypeptidase